MYPVKLYHKVYFLFIPKSLKIIVFFPISMEKLQHLDLSFPSTRAWCSLEGVSVQVVLVTRRGGELKLCKTVSGSLPASGGLGPCSLLWVSEETEARSEMGACFGLRFLKEGVSCDVRDLNLNIERMLISVSRNSVNFREK